MKFKKREEVQASIDISPLLDCTFILLIFFMVTSSFVKDMKLDLSRPGASSASPSSSKALKIYIDRQKNIYIDGQPIRPWVLQSKVREMAQSSSIESILIVVDKNVPADKLIEVVDQCRLAGLKDIGVATDNEV